MAFLKELIESGSVAPLIDRRYPLSESLKLSGAWRKATLEERSSSRCEAPTGIRPVSEPLETVE